MMSATVKALGLTLMANAILGDLNGIDVRVGVFTLGPTEAAMPVSSRAISETVWAPFSF
jgi:hypothetical protein